MVQYGKELEQAMRITNSTITITFPVAQISKLEKKEAVLNLFCEEAKRL